jgi:hypothetical protein
MEKIKATCACGKSYLVSEEYAGRSLKCKGCQAIVKIPKPEVVDDAAVEEITDAAPEKQAVKKPVQKSAAKPGTAPVKKAAAPAKRKSADEDEDDTMDVPDRPRLEDKYTPEQIGILKDSALAFWLSIFGIIIFVLEFVAFYFALRAKKAMKEQEFFEPERTVTIAMIISGLSLFFWIFGFVVKIFGIF